MPWGSMTAPDPPHLTRAATGTPDALAALAALGEAIAGASSTETIVEPCAAILERMTGATHVAIGAHDGSGTLQVLARHRRAQISGRQLAKLFDRVPEVLPSAAIHVDEMQGLGIDVGPR